ncbi:hypothetical protein FisN_11Hu313 [Fistulifera solaris]|jgi:hypothetical protein|uniref:Uncharacterized protein n=1 Tax=Fistulifera solaris TaxID=1519565 RepID=A0A1Z5JGJ1_FISSO|nr:hypothetical protein FisN_11Hu313 [Fistulifera solaris]|eukprot:GAX12888.1 hypothetical protein FisN_11Hu313 [Fistulifera solaris]
MTPSNKKLKQDVLELIPENRKTPPQKVFRRWRYGDDVPLYRLRRELTHLDDIDWEKYREFAIWRDNGTVICICEGAFDSFCYEAVCFWISRVGKPNISGAIFGLVVSDFEDFSREEINEMIDDNIAETAAFFLSLKDADGDDVRLEFDCFDEMSRFDFAAIQPEHLALMLNANPKRQFSLQNGTWSPEQAIVLATRSFPLKLKLTTSISRMKSWFRFCDKGDAFLDALEKRSSPFGSLSLSFLNRCDVPFSPNNMGRLLKCQFEKLEIGVMYPEFELLPFATETTALVYKIDSGSFQGQEFSSLRIVAKDLHLKVMIDDCYEWNWDKTLISFLKRVAQLGHFERLALSVCHWEDEFTPDYNQTRRVTKVAKALVDAIRGNPSLSCLDMSDPDSLVEWGPHMKTILKALEEHSGLRSFKVKEYPRRQDPEYAWLQRLLSRNRSITVVNHENQKISNGSSIDKLYALNRIYWGSESLVKETPGLRSALVPSALTESCSNSFQFIALIWSGHSDLLCELLHGAH